MALGIVSNEDFEHEVKRAETPLDELLIPSFNTPVIEGEVMPETRPGRNKGDRNVPDSLRRLIGEVSAIDGRDEALRLAADFNISPSSVSAYSRGATSTSSMDRQPNLNHINKAKERIGKKARMKLRRAIDLITDEKLEAADAVELSQVAKSMSAVSKDMEPETAKDGGDGNKPQFLVYSPTVVQENHYETIVARE